MKTLSAPQRGPNEIGVHRAVRKKCFLVSILCFFFALISVIMEAFAALSIQFCDGEDIMMLYWGFWNLVQVGSLIAILGIAFNQAWSLGGKEQPPWNIALGTPVLLMATLGHVGCAYLK